ncbi:MAG: hypothetical protein IPI66_12435 [Chitinophagaceae bacterium]|nr:hypothetical protein [Chitinophagaceae bacterium]MBL0056370.1 hypothetical protein [Chitinophagaceae bacterium]
MKNGISRFDHHLNQLQALLDKAAKQKNPALWLYQQNVRTPLFMLEGLAKLYSGLHNRKKFSKLKEQFKLLEDILGSVDYYDSFAREFADNKKIPAAITTYLQAQAREKIQSLNEVLTEKGWLGDGNRRIIRICKKLNEADWKNDTDEIKAINEYYGREIYEIVEFIQTRKFQFSNVEADVHELRRKLRWLSIYPQALRGCIQLANGPANPRHLKKYQTPAIIGSPFNIMPDAGGNRVFLMLDKRYYYALSWMIAELGKLKDNGLRLVAIKEALMQTAGLKEPAAYKKALVICGKDQLPLSQLLDKAELICKTYFKENNLEHLVTGIGNVKS